MDRKHCGKRRNCSLLAISSFSKSVFQKTVLQTRKNHGRLREKVSVVFIVVDIWNKVLGLTLQDSKSNQTPQAVYNFTTFNFFRVQRVIDANVYKNILGSVL